ncbi:MAG: V-type ATP synthase subunit E family protein [Candidatus Ancaeobacter aquaticus]|nr:V-type ATP synthase subunit E family protein [Candidatus Ancaeobacter aquaticus]
MESLEKQKTLLEKKIVSRAENIRDEETKKAREYVEHVVENARGQAEGALDLALQEAKAKAKLLERENKAHAELETKLHALKTKDKIVHEVLNSLWDNGPWCDEKKYTEIVYDLVEEGLMNLDYDIVFMSVGDSERTLMTQIVIRDFEKRFLEKTNRKVSLKLLKETLLQPGGVIMANDTSSVIYDNSWSARAERLKECLYMTIADIVFE